RMWFYRRLEQARHESTRAARRRHEVGKVWTTMPHPAHASETWPGAHIAARARQYALLATFLTRAPDAALLSKLSQLRADASPLGLTHAALAVAAEKARSETIAREFFDLFIGLGRGELMPYASYYLTGFLHERPLARLREDLGRIGIARADGVVEPEDHAGILCEIMSGLVSRRLAAPPDSDRLIFDKHMAPWIGRFFVDLENAEAADFYRQVGTLGRVFTDIETEAFAMPA